MENRARVGVGLLGVALALGLLPGVAGVGAAWSLVVLAGGAVVAAGEMEAAGRPAPFRVPAGLRRPWVAPAFAAVVAVHALHLLSTGMVALLWLAAAVLLVWDQARTEWVAERLDLGTAWRGHRRTVLLGAGLCLLSLFLTWGETGGHWVGGYSYNASPNYDYNGNFGYRYSYDYSPAQYYSPGWRRTGRGQPFALLAEALLLALALWAAARRGGEGSRAFRAFAPAACAVLLVWWLAHAGGGAGAWIFASGLALSAFGCHRVLRGG